jgi:hypothetical protein
MNLISSDDGNYGLHITTVTMVCECFDSPLTAQMAAEFFMEQLKESFDRVLNYPVVVVSAEVLEYEHDAEEAEANLVVLIEDSDRTYVEEVGEFVYEFGPNAVTLSFT